MTDELSELERERDIRRRVHRRYKETYAELLWTRRQLAAMTAERDSWRTAATSAHEYAQLAYEAMKADAEKDGEV